MPYRKPKRSYVLPVVTTLAVAAPLATFTMSDPTSYRTANDSELAAIPAQLAEVVLAQAPDITLPLKELTGLNLPDLHLSDLRMLPLPASIPVPEELPIPLPSGVRLPDEIPLPDLDAAPTGESAPPAPSSAQPIPAAAGAKFIAELHELAPAASPDTPALTPGAVPEELVGQVGTEVKELRRDTPFSVVALTAADLANTSARIRARQPDGSWGPWYDTEQVDTRRSDSAPPDGLTGTEPIYVGNTKAVQVLVTRKPEPGNPAPAIAPPAADLRVPAAAPVAPAPAEPADDGMDNALAELTAVLIDPGRGALDGSLNEVAAALPGGGPKVITRAQWGADESIRCAEPTYDDEFGLGGVTVHHTAGRNDYSKAESAGIVRAIYTYHAQTLGWCDIGYNALVDKYGQIFEGRYGGLNRPVQGAHAGGFNQNTAGVALMGNYVSQAPSDASINSIGRFIGWRTKIAGLDPQGYTTMYSEGTEFTSYAQGQAVRLPIVFAHRDVGNTACPGDAAYALMDRIRGIAASSPGAPDSSGSPDESVGSPDEQVESRGPSESDVAALAALAGKLLSMVDRNLIARHWVDSGGASGPLGAAKSEPLPAAQGQQYAKFANGYLYSTPDGQVFEVAGAILDRFLQLGAAAGELGLPSSNAYPVPNGLRSDFQHGSLILNELSGIVTTVWQQT